MRGREFRVLSECWYAQASLPRDVENEIHLSGAGGIEVLMSWNSQVRDESGRAAVEVRAFEEAWTAFKAWPDLFQGLASMAERGEPATVDAVRDMLLKLGFEDATERTRPSE